MSALKGSSVNHDSQEGILNLIRFHNEVKSTAASPCFRQLAIKILISLVYMPMKPSFESFLLFTASDYAFKRLLLRCTYYSVQYFRFINEVHSQKLIIITFCCLIKCHQQVIPTLPFPGPM